jgi:REP element-mobilizing transposase RayT
MRPSIYSTQVAQSRDVRPLAYLLTFGTYGSWLHGDRRGSKDPRHNTLGTPVRGHSDFLRDFEKDRLKPSPVVINPPLRRVLEASFQETCQHRGWQLLAMNVRRQHVHIVVTASDVHSPERILNDLKAYGTRAARHAGLVGYDGNLWARHGSTRWLMAPPDVEAATEYVEHWQGADLPGSSWRSWKAMPLEGWQ